MKLEDARVQLEDARDELDQFQAGLRAWMQPGKNLVFRLDPHPQLAVDLYSAVVLVPLDGKFKRQATGVTSACRQVLEYIAWQAYVDSGGHDETDEAQWVSFPIRTSAGRWTKHAVQALPGVAAEIVALVKAQQPAFRTDPGADALRALLDLSNKGKHRRLHVLGSGVVFGAASWVFREIPWPDAAINLTMYPSSFDLTARGEYPVYRVTTGKAGVPDPEPVPRAHAWQTGEGVDLGLEVYVDGGGGKQAHKADTLDAIHAEVDRILSLFESL